MRVGQEIEEFWSSEETEAETPKRNCFLQRDEDCFEDRWVALDQMVYDGMKELGWICWMSWTDTNGPRHNITSEIATDGRCGNLLNKLRDMNSETACCLLSLWKE